MKRIADCRSLGLQSRALPRFARDWSPKLLLAAAWILFIAGCSKPTVDSTYGKRRGLLGGDSVNGTGVLADMFQRAGHSVTSWKRLSPKLQKSQVIVWAPDDFHVPTIKQREFLEHWLADGRGRTLVYIGRDFDAGPLYWKKMQPLAPPGQAAEVARRRAALQAAHDQQHAAMPVEQYARWFVARRDERPKSRVQSLDGPWAEDVDAAKLEIELESRFDIPVEKDISKPKSATTPPIVLPGAVPAATPPGRTKKKPPKFLMMPPPDDGVELTYLPNYQPLLKSGEDVLVSEVTEKRWGDSKIIVVTNGSFLLNMPLVNHEHRQLAGRLIDACGPPGKTTFLESNQYSLEIYDKEPDTRIPSGLELFTVWPLNAIILHLIALGVFFCFVRFPIFGRPRTLPPETTSDFGQHLQALGELLEKTGDREYARERLHFYQQHVKRDSGVSHRPRVVRTVATSTIAAPQPTPTPPTAAAAPASGQKVEKPA